MCLSIPSKVISIDENNFAIVDTMGVRRGVSLDLIAEPVAVGDYVLIHVGFAMEKIDTQYALESLKIYEQIANDMQNGKISADEGDMGLAALKG
ncbi:MULTISPECIES: HypC/HybG/HupF family hydrogenase formation chaperone [Campylobacter]|jgi:hydrogenase expression/formation protein HypC|uniref:Hydrogenase assembly chaperone HypC n=2 Tax=Campylobacter vicugnae TaxID=1660076 RepID=A0A1X9T1X1_9BACT|nr:MULTISPECIES: HypC/HybG/HupF family hydrogenase formation chaperone [unclassified Campylobacter]MCR8690163.1 HypC/HybG/HupF family hydrogenase formation chaperone [Campylobacter sp. RM9264]MCR8700731.1 HypC/HybG/HupF family hydrogenase formation chaperone [Campylobacter sp. RM12176]ARR02537.1 hydrogenase assembly chaperone HypC [Campylobacter sp. RM8964]ARR04166.1 hydrogenase assembly chaperone HypC [Campylobacter sp. RM12175]MBO7154669.1 HypC/HybG/HupF family hydrogenase formation chaperon